MTRYDYFITLTFANEYRHFRDSVKMEIFDNFIDKLKKLVPQMQYIAIVDKKLNGDLHFHVLTSGITPQDIQCVQKAIRFGKWFYAVILWDYGYSTMGKLEKAVTVA